MLYKMNADEMYQEIVRDPKTTRFQFEGVKCSKCGSEGNVELLRGHMWTCPFCKHYNASSFSHHQIPYDTPSFGIPGTVIREVTARLQADKTLAKKVEWNERSLMVGLRRARALRCFDQFDMTVFMGVVDHDSGETANVLVNTWIFDFWVSSDGKWHPVHANGTVSGVYTLHDEPDLGPPRSLIISIDASKLALAMALPFLPDEV